MPRLYRPISGTKTWSETNFLIPDCRVRIGVIPNFFVFKSFEIGNNLFVLIL